MSSFNINNVPESIVGKVYWLVAGLKVLWGKVTALSGSGGNATNNLVPLFDHYTSVGNVGTTETDLYSDTIAANTLAADGDKLEFMYSGTVDNGTSSIFRVYFGGGVSSIYQSDVEGGGDDWTITGYVIRVSTSVIRYSINLYGTIVPTVGPVSSGEKTGLDLSNNNILKISVECTAPATPNDSAIAVLGSVKWISHA